MARWISSFRSSRSSKSSSAISTLNIRRLLDKGKIDDDLRADAGRRIFLADPDPARMKADDVFGKIEPLSPILAGAAPLVKTEVRLLFIHPDPLVPDRYRHVLSAAVPVHGAGHQNARAGLVRFFIFDGVVEHIFKDRFQERRGGIDHGRGRALADRYIGQVAVLYRHVAQHGFKVDIFELDQARLAFIRDLFEYPDVGKEFVEIVVDARLSIRRQAGEQVDSSFYPSEVVFEFMSDGGGDVADELVSPRYFLIFQHEKHVLPRPSLFLLIHDGQVHAEGGEGDDHGHQGIIRDPAGRFEQPLQDRQAPAGAGIQ